MKMSELVVLGLVVFIAIIAADLWMEKQRYLITLEINSRSIANSGKSPATVSGFARVV
jgi:hypothetical protein